MIFQHPFTHIVSGPTGCGKTTYVKKLLQHNNILIKPKITRIVWIYRYWQSMYDELARTVHPPIEFIQDIPHNLSDDSFISPNENNIIVLDDMMSTAAKDHRITELFTEGSHHRNLSVISINQNLYHSKDPTQRRNSHYICLFHNPISMDIITALSRQMYPDSPNKLMHAYRNATSKPYGYIVLDLKANTPDHARLCPNVLDITQPTIIVPHKAINPACHEDTHHLIPQYQVANNIGTNLIYNTMADPKHLSVAPHCSTCGILFATAYDLFNHTRKGCLMNNDRPIRDKNDRDSLSAENDESDYDDNDVVEEVESNPTFQQLFDDAKLDNEKNWLEKVEKFKTEGSSQKEAEIKADGDMLDADKRKFFKHLKYFLYKYKDVEESTIFHKIIEDFKKYVASNLRESRAMNKAVRNNMHSFDDLFDNSSDDTMSDETTADDDTDVDMTGNGNNNNKKVDFWQNYFRPSDA